MDGQVRRAVESYASTNYWNINNGLRQGHDPKIAQQIDQALTPLPYDVMVYRGIRSLDEVNGEPKIGSEITQLGFMSTSVDDKFDFAIARNSKIHLSLEVPAGTLALYVEDMVPWVQDGGEQELLLQRGLTWKITDVRLHKFRKAFEQHNSKLYRVKGVVYVPNKESTTRARQCVSVS